MAVRNERVVLSLQDDLSTGVVQAAAAFALLDQRIEEVSGHSRQAGASQAKLAKGIDTTATSVKDLHGGLVMLRSSSSALPSATDSANRSLAVMAVNSSRADSSINQLTGRLGLFRDLAITMGPALSPLGGVLLAGVGGLANQLGVAALAGASVIATFQGVGTALDAVNKAAIEPSAKNLQAASDALDKLSPSAREAVQAMGDLRPVLLAIRDAGAEQLFPGVTRALDSLESRAPEVTRIVASLNDTVAQLLAGGAAELAGAEWDEFFDFLATDARDTLAELGQSVGFLSSGLASMWMAFDPLNDDFSSWALRSAESFSTWADALGETEGFSEFVDYIRDTGPQVADTFGAMGNAILQIVQATAPLGGPVLGALEAVSDAVAAIADSDLGTPFFVGVAAIVAYNRALAMTASLQARVGGSTMLSGMAGAKGLSSSKTSLTAARADVEALAATWATAGARTSREQARVAASSASLRTNLAGVAKGAGPAAAGLAGITLASTGAADGIGLTNTASLALMGYMVGPWGAAVGAGVGALMDMSKTSDDAFEALDRLGDTLERMPAQATAADMQLLNAQFDLAKEKVAELSDMRDSPFSSGGAFLGSIKNDVEDTFGRSDIEEAEAALAEYEAQMETAKWSTSGLAGATGSLEDQADALAATTRAEADALRDAVDAMREKRQEAIRSFDAVTNYHAAIDDGNKALKTNGRTLNVNTEAGRANRDALSGLASAWNNLSDRQKNSVGTARAARKGFVELAVGMGMPRQQARQLARELMEIPSKRVTDVGIKGRDEVIAQARAIRDAIDAATKDRRVNILVSMPNLPSDRKLYGGLSRNADGGTVPNTGLPYADRHPYLLADLEEVVSNRYGQAERYRPVLKGINANLPPSVIKGMLADGGTAGGEIGSAASVSRRGYDGWSEKRFERAIDRLAGRLDKATSSLEDWRTKMVAVGEASTSQFVPDLFGNPGGAWGPGSSPLSAVMGSTAELNQRQLLQAQLKKAGISGDAYASLMTGSNTDLTAFLASGEASKYQKAYDTYAKKQAQVASDAGKYAYGKQEAAAEKRVGRLAKELRETRMEARRAAREERQWRKNNPNIARDTAKGVSRAAGNGATQGRRKALTRIS